MSTPAITYLSTKITDTIFGTSEITAAVGSGPTRESFHLGMAKRAYVNGGLSLEEFEQSIEHVLRGCTLNADGRIPQYVSIHRTVIESPYADTY